MGELGGGAGVAARGSKLGRAMQGELVDGAQPAVAADSTVVALLTPVQTSPREESWVGVLGRLLGGGLVGGGGARVAVLARHPQGRDGLERAVRLGGQTAPSRVPV